MSDYLRKKFVNKYKVMAEYDTSRMDFIRDADGNLDSSFSDYYIPCQKNGKISQFERDILQYYIPNKKIGSGIVNKINSQEPEAIFDVDFTDSEVAFYFKAKDMDILAPILKPRRKGAKISPFSEDNIPCRKYVIPQEDVQRYKEAIASKGYVGCEIGRLTKQYDKILTAKLKRKGVNAKEEKQKRSYNLHGFIHDMGFWDDYIKFLMKG